MEQDGGSSAGTVMIPDGDGGSTMTAPEAKKIKSKEKHELVPQLRFPSGYHFLPTDLELVDFYLRRKIEGQKLPLDIFMEVNLLDWEPEKLVAERKAYGEDTYFFFTVRKDSPCNKPGQPRRKLEVKGVSASWKATGKVMEIRRPGTAEVVGTRRMLTYSCGNREDDKYSMFEYILTSRSEMDQWVLCTIREKQNWNADQNQDENASGGKDKKVSVSEDKKRKRGTDTLEPKTTKRKRKTATSQPQETQEQQQQEIASATSTDPPPLLGHEQADHRQALQDEKGVMAFEGPSPVIQAVIPHEYPCGGDQPHYHDASMQQETIPWDVPGEPPLMTHQQHGYQASEQFMLERFAAMFQCQGQQQLDNIHELLWPYGYGSMPSQLLQHSFQYALTTQGFHRDVTLQPESGKPPETSPSPDSVLRGLDPELPSGDACPYSDGDAGMMNGVASPVVPQATSYGSAADDQFNPIHSLGHNSHDNLSGNGGSSDVAMGLPNQESNQGMHTCQHASMRYQLLKHQFQYGLRTQGFQGDITGTMQNVPPFLPESGKPPGTSPASVLGGPDPGLPLGDARPYSDSDVRMMNGFVSTMATNYGPADDHQYNPADLQGHNFDDNLAGDGDSSHLAMGLPDQGTNQALHMCPHGIQWLCGEQQCVM